MAKTNFASWALCLVFLFACIILSASGTNPSILERGVPATVKKCRCTVGDALFADEVKGIMVFSQDKNGSTLVDYAFSSGLSNPQLSNYDYLLVSPCGKVLYNLTSKLNVTYCRNGGTLPYSTFIDDLNLGCGTNSVFSYQNEKCKNSTNTKIGKRASCSRNSWKLKAVIQKNKSSYACAHLKKKRK